MQKTTGLSTDENNSRATISYNGTGTAMNNTSGCATNYDESNGSHHQSRSGSVDTASTVGLPMQEFVAIKGDAAEDNLSQDPITVSLLL